MDKGYGYNEQNFGTKPVGRATALRNYAWQSNSCYNPMDVLELNDAPKRPIGRAGVLQHYKPHSTHFHGQPPGSHSHKNIKDDPYLSLLMGETLPPEISLVHAETPDIKKTASPVIAGGSYHYRPLL